MRKITLRTAVILVVAALLIQYLFLKGPEAVSVHLKHYAISTFSQDFKPHQYRITPYSVALELPPDTEVSVSLDQGEEVNSAFYFV
jgi:hypothetical protein